MQALDIMKLLTELLKQTNPGAILWVAAASALTKGVVDLVKRFFPKITGNPVQTLTLAVAFIATLIQAALAGIFTNGVDGKEIQSIVIVTALVWGSAIGINEIFTNRGGGIVTPPPVSPPTTTEEAQQRLENLRNQ